MTAFATRGSREHQRHPVHRVRNAFSGNFASNGTSGNTVFLVVTANTSGSGYSTSAPTLGGSPVIGAVKLAEGLDPSGGISAASIWMLPDCPGGSSSVAVTVTGGTPNAYCGLAAYEARAQCSGSRSGRSGRSSRFCGAGSSPVPGCLPATRPRDLSSGRGLPRPGSFCRHGSRARPDRLQLRRPGRQPAPGATRLRPAGARPCPAAAAPAPRGLDRLEPRRPCPEPGHPRVLPASRCPRPVPHAPPRHLPRHPLLPAFVASQVILHIAGALGPELD